MKRWKLYSSILAALIFLTVNIYLIVKDDSKVSRTVFVKEWTTVKSEDIIETFQTEGVIKPKEVYPVYYGRENKEFMKFLVQEGDAVTAGTPLFEYDTPKLDTLKANLEAEKSQITGEIAAIDEYIGKLESYQATIPETASGEDVSELETELNIEEDASSDIILSTIEQEIYKQELEKSNLEEKIKKYDTQLSNQADSGTATVASEADGVVKQIDQNLGNPIITIASSQSAVEGNLSEKQLKQAKPGMKIKITSTDLKKPVDGTLEQINTIPAEEPSVKKASTYVYQAAMKKESGKLVKGSRVGVSVITREARGVPAVPEKAVKQQKKKPFLYQLTSKGYTSKQYIDRGLAFKGKQEVKNGVALGDIIVLSPDDRLHNHSMFITQLNAEKVKKSAIKRIPKREKVRYLLIGIIEQ
ncbi:efflux RND transporter periplasmic adaptor subunit [Peribacillus cavernae]|nr:efflux RND transporter periplasmic adaptor subunit [Peribacillus cavernae]MDQ0221284.1 HlyD family secretion protein [Peribacillus cavernae]